MEQTIIALDVISQREKVTHPERAFANSLKADCSAAVYVFGSYARNEATTESDIDLLIDREGSIISSLFDMGALYNDCVAALQKEVDIITVQTLEQNSTKEKSSYLIENIKREKQLIYMKE